MNIDIASHGIVDICLEFEKQRRRWSEAHDDEHANGELLIAASQLIDAVLRPDAVLPDMWGLVSKHQHPRVRLRIAAALVASELDRRERAALAKFTPGTSNPLDEEATNG